MTTPPHMGRTKLLKMTFALAFAAGCASEPAVVEPVGPPARQACPAGTVCDFDMELGTGLTELELIEPEGEVTVSLGPQGGFHIWLAVRCRDCAPQVLIEYGVRGSADGAWLYGDPLRGIINLDDASDGWRQVAGLYGLLPGGVGEIDYTGLDVTLEATIEDGDRRSIRTVPVHVARVEVWDCPSSDPDHCSL